MNSSVIRIQDASQVALGLVQSEYPTYHPLIALARLAHRKEVIDDPRLEFEVHKSLLPYVTPRLSAIEVKQETREERRVIVSLFEMKTLENGSTVDVEVPLITDVSELVRLD